MLPSWFKPYAGPPSRAQDGAGNIFYAQLGSTNGDKTTFRVYVFRVARDGSVAEVPIVNGPKNHATLSESGDTLVLCGERDGVISEWAVAGWVAKQAASDARIPPEAPTDLNDKDYASLDEMFGVPGFRERFNKQLRAILQLRRLARARGWFG